MADLIHLPADSSRDDILEVIARFGGVIVEGRIEVTFVRFMV